MFISWTYVGSYTLLTKVPIAFPEHVSDIMSVLLFTQVTIPIISSEILGKNALVVLVSILNILVEKKKKKQQIHLQQGLN